jgi:DNA-binding HxlR family transcriptional regulator
MTTTYEAQNCSLARALELIGERWTLLIIRDAFYGVRRFNHFRDHLDIPRAMLVERLATLVDNGILSRCPDPDHAARYLYELTPLGRDLWPALHALLCWGARVAGPNQLRFLHVVCGNEIDNHGNCRACDLTPAPTAIATEPRSRKPGGRTDAVAIALRQRHTLLEPLNAIV